MNTRPQDCKTIRPQDYKTIRPQGYKTKGPSGLKMWKASVAGALPHFWPTCNNICYGHFWNKNNKKLNFFANPMWGGNL